jgi:hypothetical protein
MYSLTLLDAICLETNEDEVTRWEYRKQVMQHSCKHYTLYSAKKVKFRFLRRSKVLQNSEAE